MIIVIVRVIVIATYYYYCFNLSIYLIYLWKGHWRERTISCERARYWHCCLLSPRTRILICHIRHSRRIIIHWLQKRQTEMVCWEFWTKCSTKFLWICEKEELHASPTCSRLVACTGRWHISYSWDKDCSKSWRESWCAESYFKCWRSKRSRWCCCCS